MFRVCLYDTVDACCYDLQIFEATTTDMSCLWEVVCPLLYLVHISFLHCCIGPSVIVSTTHVSNTSVKHEGCFLMFGLKCLPAHMLFDLKILYSLRLVDRRSVETDTAHTHLYPCRISVPAHPLFDFAHHAVRHEEVPEHPWKGEPPKPRPPDSGTSSTCRRY